MSAARTSCGNQKAADLIESGIAVNMPLAQIDPSFKPSAHAYRSFCDVLEDDCSSICSVAASGQAPENSIFSHEPPSTFSTLPRSGAPVNKTRDPNPRAQQIIFAAAASTIRTGLVGRHKSFRTPYGSKPLVYCDWTATGRAVDSIEKYLHREVLPLFGNTHTTTSITGGQTTCFRHEARQIIAQAVNAKITGRAAEDVVLFTGTGATAAVAKLVTALGLSGPLSHEFRQEDRPVIFVGPFEHHSNLLPWRESYGEVVTIRETASGGLDLLELEDKLRLFASRKLKIGSFSAASNVTGVLEDVDRVTATLHRAGALALWDYATAAPHVRVDMNPAPSGAHDQALVAKDAVFFSGHKFVGGPGTPGVLVVKKRLLCNPVPGTVGGGTVFFVTQDDHRYLSNKEEREEGGTPDILGSIRLGLAVQMKEALGYRAIMEREEELATLGLNKLRAHPGIVVLGDSGRKRLPIFSFLVRSKGGGRFLHYNFVCALLNDLFGVQTRGGCQCAGPYSQHLLGLSLRDTRAIEAELLRKHELLRPGFSRLSLSYVDSDSEARYILDAVLFVADNGASFLPQYRANYKTGEWKHKTRFTRFPERRWLGHCDYGFAPPCSPETSVDATPHGSVAVNGEGIAVNGGATKTAVGKEESEGAREEQCFLEEVFEDAARHLRAAEGGSRDERWQGAEDVLGEEGEALRWFPYPWEGSASREAASPPFASPGSTNRIGGRRCVVDPKVYGAGAVNTLEEEGDTGGTVEPQSGERRGDGVAAGGVGGSADDNMKATEAECVRSVITPDGAAGGGSGSGFILNGGEEMSEGKASAKAYAVGSGRSESTRSGAGGGDDVVRNGVGKNAVDNTSPKEEMEIPSFLQRRPRNIDDSHKYPLRTTGEAGLRAATPPFPSIESTGLDSGIREINGNIRGYEGHMSALEKLGDGSPRSRLFPNPGKKIMKAAGQAIQEWRMVEDGDRLCLGLSGGKDSMTLLHVLLALKKKAPIRFELVCATVDPQTPSFDPSPLIPYLERLGVKLHYISSPIIEQAKTSLQGDSLCAFCARMKRGLLYACCREHGYNKLVLAQHLDDLAESFIMSALHNGQVRTMKANYKIEAGDVRVIRPLCYAREALTKDFARTNRLPIVNENCPACFEEPKERHRVKKMLAKEESLFPTIYANLRKALVPLMDDSVYGAMDKTSSEVAARQGLRRTQPATKGKGAPARDPGAGEGVTERADQKQPCSQEKTITSGSAGYGAADDRDEVAAALAGSGHEDDIIRLEGFSDDALELELVRRRRHRDSRAKPGEGSVAACGPL